MIRNFPVRYHDIVKDLVVDEKSYVVEALQTLDLKSGESSVPKDSGKRSLDTVNITLGALGEARLFFAPGDLGERIWRSDPRFVSSDMVRMPFDNVFIEFGVPIEGAGFGDDVQAKVYGIHVTQIELNGNRCVLMVKWGRSKINPNEWVSSIFSFHCGKIAQVSNKDLVIDGKNYKVPDRLSSSYLSHLAFVMFLNSSNVSYEIRKSSQMPRPKDKSWWRREYESKFEELVVKDVPRRIALSLRRSETGTGWSRPTFVRGHFKVMSYCGVCGLKRAVLRFLRNEVCKCGSPLNPETAKTKTFWWEGHWAGADIVDRVIAERA